MSDINIQLGHVRRHTPQGLGAGGQDSAIIDIAQDLLLRHLHDQGLFDDLVFKGGTALRKLYAGKNGRFSTDLDFSTAEIGVSQAALSALVAEEVNGLRLGPFEYSVEQRRGKSLIGYRSDTLGFAGNVVTSKLDVGPAPWLTPIERPWVPLEIHGQYGGGLPALPVMHLEENLAEKIARTNRGIANADVKPRDLYDLWWVSEQRDIFNALDRPALRRIAVLKVWTDANGLRLGETNWKHTEGNAPFSPAALLAIDPTRVDLDDIGYLGTKLPTAEEMTRSVHDYFRFLMDIDPDESAVATLDPRHSNKVLAMLRELTDGRLDDAYI